MALHCTEGFLGKPCGKRTCSDCYLRYLADRAWCLRENLSIVGVPVRMVTLTAPGADRLPWDRHACAWRGPHQCRGRLGCVVEEDAASEWRATLEQRWRRLHQAAARRAGCGASCIIARVWQAQARGVAHVHVVVPAVVAGDLYAKPLMELAPHYDFGEENDGGRVGHSAAVAAYLSGYLSRPGDSFDVPRKRDLAEIAATVPRRQVYISPHLTRRSGATMRTARLVRSLWALGEGFREGAPYFRDEVEEAWAYYWLRVGRRGRGLVPRSVVVPDYGEYEPWAVRSWPGASALAMAA
jgi:hypothetical protein